MTMVAEGVEDGETAGQLALSSCDKIQGFYFSKALPSAELELWMDARVPSASSLFLPAPDTEAAL
jgi:EAL domain-containing protein (putative c-di-GMP-specific phosphodiesterase class I)